MSMQISYKDMLEQKPYSLEKKRKQMFLNKRLLDLTKRHYQFCEEYRKIVNALGIELDKIKSYYDLPFIPVRLFKELELMSISKTDIVKTITSSGTTDMGKSTIYLDRETADYQQKIFVKLVSSFIGSSRMPMLIIDNSSSIKNRDKFSARGVGILGFSVFGREKRYILDENMQLDVKNMVAFLEKHKNERILLFGFTFIIWEYFYKELLRLKQKGIKLDLSNAILIHGGGWKKSAENIIPKKEFYEQLRQVSGLVNIYDYYGMVEQTGSIYMQCEYGYFHTSNFSDVIVRRPLDFSICNFGENGIIQVVSTIPQSYPGQSLLTEDEGMILGEDDCPCGRKGKYFLVAGRLRNAEIRGCSDTYAIKF